MNVCIWLIASDIDFFRIFRRSKLSHHIFWQIYKHWSWLPAACNVKCLLDDPAQFFPAVYRHPILCNTPCDSYNIHLLKRIVSNQMTRHLPGKAYKRYAVIIGRGKPCHQVRCSRSACHQTDADFSSGSCIGIGLVNKCLLMSWENNLNVSLFVKLVADIYCTCTGIAKERIHPFLF